MALHYYKAVILKDNTIVKASSGQFLCWGEKGRRLELWQEEPLRLLKYWLKNRVLVIVVSETARNSTNTRK